MMQILEHQHQRHENSESKNTIKCGKKEQVTPTCIECQVKAIQEKHPNKFTPQRAFNHQNMPHNGLKIRAKA